MKQAPFYYADDASPNSPYSPMLIGPNIHSRSSFGNAARQGPSFDALHDVCFQPPLFTDLPELPHDSDFPTPPSASSSRMIDTPPHYWHAPLAVEEEDFSAEARGNSPYLKSTQLSKDTEHHRPWSETAMSDNYWDRERECGRIPISLDLAPNELSSEHTIFSPPSSYSSYPHQTHFDTHRKLSIGPKTLMLPPLPSIPAESPSNSSIAPSTSSWPSHATQVPIKLHQPRPSRRIPIVSLDELASISENFILPPHKTCHLANSPVEALSPLPFDFHHQSFESNHARICEGGLQSKSDNFCPKFSMLRPPDGGEPRQVILCSCGCMETYTFH